MNINLFAVNIEKMFKNSKNELNFIHDFAKVCFVSKKTIKRYELNEYE